MNLYVLVTIGTIDRVLIPPLTNNIFTNHASDGDDVFGSAAVKVVEPGVVGHLAGAAQSLVHLAQSRKRLRK